MCWQSELNVLMRVLTDGVSSLGRISGDGERAESKSVLSLDPEQILLTFE